MTHTPPSGPFELVTTPPISSASMRTVGAGAAFRAWTTPNPNRIVVPSPTSDSRVSALLTVPPWSAPMRSNLPDSALRIKPQACLSVSRRLNVDAHHVLGFAPEKGGTRARSLLVRG